MALLIAAPALAQTPEWRPTRTSIAGANDGEIGDLNGDGRPDVVARNRGKPELAVYLAEGAARFPAMPSTLTPLGYGPTGITLADVNADGRMDIGVTSRDDTSEYAQILLGDGKGGLSPLPRFPVSPSSEFYKPRFLFGDFNEDGKVDMLAGNGRHQVFRILFGDGKGGFDGGRAITLDYVPHNFHVGVADLNGDRHLDLIAPGNINSASVQSRFLVKLGDGKGGFRTIQDMAINLDGAPRTELADIDRDGDVDALLSHGHTLSVFLNDGTGRLAESPMSPARQPRETFETQVVDVNGDGRKDIAAATVDSVTVLLGTGEGFVPASGSPYPAGPGAYVLRSADLNGDGKPDIVSNAFESDSLGVLLGG
jgi:hypothetical protein